MTRTARWGSAGVGLLLIALLATAAWLPPDPRGYGTHQQLGLPPCSFRRVFGQRCPSCGMTTSWSHLMRGELRKSLESNSAGTLLAVLSVIAGPWMLACAGRGKWIGRPPGPRTSLVLLVAMVAVALVDWTVHLALG